MYTYAVFSQQTHARSKASDCDVLVLFSFYSQFRFVALFVFFLLLYEPQPCTRSHSRIMQGHHAAGSTTPMREQLYQMGPAKNANGGGNATTYAGAGAAAEQPKPPQLPPRDSHYGTHGPQHGQDLPTVCVCLYTHWRSNCV